MELPRSASSAFFRFCKQYMDSLHQDIVVIMETRIDPLKIKGSFNRWGFDGFLCSEIRGFAGGIAVGWKQSVVNISLLVKDIQFLDLQLIAPNDSEWFFSPVYASPNDGIHNDLWTKLQSIAESRQGRWLVAGDLVIFLVNKKRRVVLQSMSGSVISIVIG